ncbi:RrF2 family transcriptional regulator [Marinobacterium weihaiense]|uniref:Rrf2 family transcriptional regulator n=1 Tax=Marinobacterium weihaiense TaxID=2851016 RepID=A0ABS6M6E9_9GAMM|nr:Rrf2 family transcriptional regulator [Marinobacterium weihaiense]MBV0931854.1 Rrf2 family transcriptional regulator [Marinobacterium weihaiense]
MQLSRFTDYSLRVLFYVATNRERLATLGEIAGFYGISLEHLRKVVHALGKSGHLETFRGKKGGIRLAIAPSSINLGALIKQTEGEYPLIDCSIGPCCLVTSCSLQTVLAEAQRAFFSCLSGYTLDDLLDNPVMQQQLIATDEP